MRELILAIILLLSVIATAEEKKTKIAIYGGAGPDRIEVEDITPNLIRIKQGFGPVYGFGVGRKVASDVNINFIGLSNKTALIGVESEF